jgi:hypothetical protein
MASPEIIINNIARTSIKLDELIVPNRTGDTNPNDTSNALAQDTDDKSFGAYRPVVFINGYYVERFMDYFEMDMNGFLPVVRFQFRMGDPLFISVNYPKDGDIVSIYIRSWVSVYKPIRMDFNILSVRSTQSSGPEGEAMVFNILAETRIPGLYSEVSKAFPSNTSYDTLFDVSQDLDLGFSANETDMEDLMTWICPNLSYYDFIKEVISRSYKDDRSFFRVWIDPYYNLTFVNLENQLSATDYIQNVKVIRGLGTGTADDTSFVGTGLPEQEMPLVLTNQKGSGDLPIFIQNYTLVSSAGNITNYRGYIQEVQFYDEGLVTDNAVEKYIHYTIESVTSETIGTNEVLQKGRAVEDEYKIEIRKNWYGVLNNFESGGVHENFIQALIQNEFNSDDLSKFTLRVETSGYFGGLYKGQAVPVAIYVNSQGKRKENAGVNDDQRAQESVNPVMDMFLSGIYILTGVTIKYDPLRGITQVLSLSRREWTLNSAGEFPKFFPVNFNSR